MADCEYLDKCPIWARFQSDIKKIWIKNYCQGEKQSRCARKNLSLEGTAVPADLLPNGTTHTE
jgi:hypothetical protein